MLKRKKLQENLAEITALRVNPTAKSSVEKLGRALTNKSNHIVAAAAEIVGEYGIDQLEEDLVQAFSRFLVNPIKTDPGCAAKAAIAETLYRMSAYQEALFLTGIHHTQLEPVYGGKEDTAAKLRVACGMGLVGMKYPDVMVELAQLLADHELDARIGAVRAIASSRQDAGIPLLRFKALIGDDDPGVLLECFNALLTLSPEPSLPFVGEFLDDENMVVCEAAAVALGESQLEGAFDILRMGWEQVLDPGLRRIELLAMAMLRHEKPIDFLLSLIADASQGIAQDAIAAMEMYQCDEKIWGRVQKIADSRDDIDLSTAVHR